MRCQRGIKVSRKLGLFRWTNTTTKSNQNLGKMDINVLACAYLHFTVQTLADLQSTIIKLSHLTSLQVHVLL